MKHLKLNLWINKMDYKCKLFIKFLKKYNVFGRYMIIFNNQRLEEWDYYKSRFSIKEQSFKNFLKCVVEKSDYSEFLNRSFIWADTEEGHDYWERLSNEWVVYYRNIKSNLYE